MKTPKDPRHVARQVIVKELFAQSFTKQPHRNQTVKNILLNLENIDSTISTIAPEFPIDKINRVDLAILRLGVYEITIDKTQPKKVIIDEAVELAKELGGDTSASFINGALGKLVKDMENEDTNV